MTTRTATLCLLLILTGALLLPAVGAQEKKGDAPKPEVKGLSVLGVFAGRATTVMAYGENLKPQSLTFDRGPLIARALGPAEATTGDEKKRAGQRLKIEVNAPTDAPPGVYRLTFSHPGGVKSEAPLAVWRPAAAELTVRRPCDTFASAMPLSGTDIAVAGALEKGDTPDLFRFDAKPGEVWRITLQAGRAGSAMDAVLRVRDARRVPLLLAAGDERADREVTFRPARPGPYYLEVSDAEGQSGPACLYRLTLRQVE